MKKKIVLFVSTFVISGAWYAKKSDDPFSEALSSPLQETITGMESTLFNREGQLHQKLQVAAYYKKKGDPIAYMERPLFCTYPLEGASPSPYMPSTHWTHPLSIQSDQARLEPSEHQALYTGNVIVTQGEYVLHAHTLLVQKDQEGGLKHIIARGMPATFQATIPSTPAPYQGQAETITYYPTSRRLVLEGHAQIIHQTDTFKGPFLQYCLTTRVITAEKRNHERPTITLSPPAHHPTHSRRSQKAT